MGHVWFEDTSWMSEEVSKKVSKSRWWFQRFFMFTPYLGNVSNLTHIFQRG